MSDPGEKVPKPPSSAHGPGSNGHTPGSAQNLVPERTRQHGLSHLLRSMPLAAHKGHTLTVLGGPWAPATPCGPQAWSQPSSSKHSLHPRKPRLEHEGPAFRCRLLPPRARTELGRPPVGRAGASVYRRPHRNDRFLRIPNTYWFFRKQCLFPAR